MRLAQRDHVFDELVNLRVLLQVTPVVPARCVILTIGVVVTTLRAAELVAALQHRHAPGNEERQQEVADLALTQRLDIRIPGRTLDTVVRTEIVVRAIPVLLAVGEVVFVGEAHEVVQREAVVTGDEVDTALRALAGLRIDILAAADTTGEGPQHAVVTAPEAPY